MTIGPALAATVLAACGTPVTGGDTAVHGAVLSYCERFARATPARLLDGPAGSYVAGSARVRSSRLVDATLFLSNVFQPTDSRFVDAWHCTFSIAVSDSRCAGEVALPIAEHAEFAEYTSWPRLTIVEGNGIAAADGETIGYVTPKYFETSCPQAPTEATHRPHR